MQTKFSKMTEKELQKWISENPQKVKKFKKNDPNLAEELKSLSS